MSKRPELQSVSSIYINVVVDFDTSGHDKLRAAQELIAGYRAAAKDH